MNSFHPTRRFLLRLLANSFDSIANNDDVRIEARQFFADIGYIFDVSLGEHDIGQGQTAEQPNNGFVGLKITEEGVVLSFGIIEENGVEKSTARLIEWPDFSEVLKNNPKATVVDLDSRRDEHNSST